MAVHSATPCQPWCCRHHGARNIETTCKRLNACAWPQFKSEELQESDSDCSLVEKGNDFAAPHRIFGGIDRRFLQLSGSFSSMQINVRSWPKLPLVKLLHSDHWTGKCDSITECQGPISRYSACSEFRHFCTQNVPRKLWRHAEFHGIFVPNFWIACGSQSQRTSGFRCFSKKSVSSRSGCTNRADQTTLR